LVGAKVMDAVGVLLDSSDDASRAQALGDLVNAGVEESLARAMSTLPAALREHVVVDAPKARVRLSNHVVLAAIRAAAVRAEFEVVEVRREGDGYFCAVKKGTNVVRVTATVSSIVWNGRNVRVTLQTPVPVEIDGRPVVNFLVAALVGLIGGTHVAESILSLPLPTGVRWNGQVAVLEFELPADVKLPSWVESTAMVTFEVTHDADGMWLKFSSQKTLSLYLSGLVGLLVQALHGG
jgi:hypothetical protein